MSLHPNLGFTRTIPAHVRSLFKFPVGIPESDVRSLRLAGFVALLSTSSVNINNTTALSSDSFYYSIIDSAWNKSHLNQIHAQLLVSGLQSSSFLITKLIHSVCNIGEIGYARKVFDEFPDPDVFSWNAIIKGYSNHNMLSDAANSYIRMQWAEVSPDSYTFPYILKCCTGLPLEAMGRAVHGQIYRHGFETDVFLQNGLVSLYAKWGRISQAKAVFNGLSDKNVVSWTTIISGCARNGELLEAVSLFSDMRKLNVMADWIALVSVLKAYTDLDDLEQGKCVHGCVIKLGLEMEEDLVISLTAMYAKCGQVKVARGLFDKETTTSNVIIWNAMISGYAKNGYAEEAVELFKSMINRNMVPDSITVRAAISACSQVGLLHLARWMDDYILGCSQFRHDLFVNTALIDMYSKCGSMDLARRVFDRATDKDVVMWSAMIVGYGLHGRGQEAIELYDAMLRAGVHPNDVTFVGLLTACKHSGLVKQGWDIFNNMRRKYGVEPRHQHYACIVDILGRAGHIHDAYKLIMNMPIEPRASVWGALLTACRIHRHVAMGEHSAGKLFAIDPHNTGHYVQLSNLYASARMWSHVTRVREMMIERGLSKDLGYSSIDVDGKLHVFHVGDTSHPRFRDIVKELVDIERRLKEAGFVMDVESILHDVDTEDVEEVLCNHSERLAIAFGLISTPPGTTLRIIKNLRACVNCHSAIKLISKLENREVVVRDANRFHHFKDGVCSCGDYW